MARKLREEYPGAIYHVKNRGDHGIELDFNRFPNFFKDGTTDDRVIC